MPATSQYMRLVGIGALTLALLGGCESTQDSASMENAGVVDPAEFQRDILWDLTPELVGLQDRSEDFDVRIYRRANTDLRMFWDDLISAMYWDRPTRLSPYPMP